RGVVFARGSGIHRKRILEQAQVSAIPELFDVPYGAINMKVPHDFLESPVPALDVSKVMARSPHAMFRSRGVHTRMPAAENSRLADAAQYNGFVCAVRHLRHRVAVVEKLFPVSKCYDRIR